MNGSKRTEKTKKKQTPEQNPAQPHKKREQQMATTNMNEESQMKCKCGRHDVVLNDRMLSSDDLKKRWQVDIGRVQTAMWWEGLPHLELRKRERFPLSCLIAWEQEHLKVKFPKKPETLLSDVPDIPNL